MRKLVDIIIEYVVFMSGAGILSFCILISGVIGAGVILLVLLGVCMMTTVVLLNVQSISQGRVSHTSLQICLDLFFTVSLFWAVGYSYIFALLSQIGYPGFFRMILKLLFLGPIGVWFPG